MEKFANKFAEWLVSKGADEENKEIFAYSMECLLNTVLTFGIILIVGAILGRLPITLVWIVFFLPLRHASGGLHAPNHIGCLILSLSVGIGCMLLNPFLVGLDWFVAIGVAGSIIIIFLFAPVIHANHPFSVQRILHMKKTARTIILVESCLVALLFFFTPASFATAAVLGILSATISTLIGHITN